MSKYNKTILTNAGLDLATRSASGQTSFEITKVVSTSDDMSGLDEASLQKLQEIPNVVQTGEITNVDTPAENKNSILGTEVLFDNKDLKDSYKITAIGLYAKESGKDKEVLYALTTAEEPEYIPSFSNQVILKFRITIYVIVGRTENVTVNVDPAGFATKEYVDTQDEKTIKEATAYADNKYVSAIAEANKYTDEKFSGVSDVVSNLQVGGVNYLNNSNFAKGLENWRMWNPEPDTTKNSSVNLLTPGADFKNLGTGKAIHIFKPESDKSVDYGIAQDEIFVNTSSTYTLSTEAVGANSGLVSLQIGLVKSDKTIEWIKTAVKATTGTPDNRRISYTFKTKADTDFVNVYIGYCANYSGDVYVTRVKLEQGSVATDWTDDNDLSNTLGRKNIPVCANGTNINDFLKSDKVSVGFSIVRDDNQYANLMVYKEPKDLWIYAISIPLNSNDNGNRLKTLTISNGTNGSWKTYDPNMYPLSGALDLNDYTSAGKYRVQGLVEGSKNIPPLSGTRWGILEVFSEEDTSFKIQRYTDIDTGKFFIRSFSGLPSKTWSEWNTFSSNEELKGFAKGVKYYDNVGNAKTILAGDDDLIDLKDFQFRNLKEGTIVYDWGTYAAETLKLNEVSPDLDNFSNGLTFYFDLPTYEPNGATHTGYPVTNYYKDAIVKNNQIVVSVPINQIKVGSTVTLLASLKKYDGDSDATVKFGNGTVDFVPGTSNSEGKPFYTKLNRIAVGIDPKLVLPTNPDAPEDSGVNVQPDEVASRTQLWAGNLNTATTQITLSAGISTAVTGLQFHGQIIKTPIASGASGEKTKLDIVASRKNSVVSGKYAVTVPHPINIEKTNLKVGTTQTVVLDGIGEGLSQNAELQVPSISFKIVDDTHIEVSFAEGHSLDSLSAGNNGAMYDFELQLVNTYEEVSEVTQLPNGTVLAEGDFSDGDILLNDKVNSDLSNVGDGIVIEFSDKSSVYKGASLDGASVILKNEFTYTNPTFINQISNSLKVRIPKEKLISNSNIFSYDAKLSNDFVYRKTHSDDDSITDYTSADKLNDLKALSPIINITTTDKPNVIKELGPFIMAYPSQGFWTNQNKLTVPPSMVSISDGTLNIQKSKSIKYNTYEFKISNSDYNFGFSQIISGNGWVGNDIANKEFTFFKGPNIKAIRSYRED